MNSVKIHFGSKILVTAFAQQDGFDGILLRRRRRNVDERGRKMARSNEHPRRWWVQVKIAKRAIAAAAAHGKYPISFVISSSLSRSSMGSGSFV